MHFIITDWIHWKQYSLDDVKKAEEQFERCVNRARKNLITLTKCDDGYMCDDGHKIARNWNTRIPESDRELEKDIYGKWVCSLCWDAIHDEVGFCRRCKPSTQE